MSNNRTPDFNLIPEYQLWLWREVWYSWATCEGSCCHAGMVDGMCTWQDGHAQHFGARI